LSNYFFFLETHILYIELMSIQQDPCMINRPTKKEKEKKKKGMINLAIIYIFLKHLLSLFKTINYKFDNFGRVEY